MKFNYKLFIILIILFMCGPGCGDYPIFTDLGTNRLKVVIKGTFESNNPRSWDVITDTTVDYIQDDSVVYYPYSTEDVFPSHVMLDIAEMRLRGKETTKFSLYRQTKKIELIDDTPFFNGEGIRLDCDDVNPDNTYRSVYLYLRKMLFNNAMMYKRGVFNWEPGELIKDIFEERTVEGYNYNNLQVNTYYDRFQLNYDDINRVFPVKIPIVGNLQLKQDEDGRIKKSVLEIRLVIKNFVKKYEYEYEYDDDESLIIYHFYGVSDWLRDVQAYDLGKENRMNAMGGNLHAVARYYIPSETGRITGTNSTANNGYVIALPEGSSIDDYITPSSSTARRDNPCNFPVSPKLTVAAIEPYLDYYLGYEKYKYQYNQKLATCSDTEGNGSQELFESNWNTYEASVENFTIPSLVTYVTAGSNYTIENVMPGNYDIYFFPELASSYGKLYRESDLTTAAKTSVGSAAVSTGVDSTVNF